MIKISMTFLVRNRIFKDAQMSSPTAPPPPPLLPFSVIYFKAEMLSSFIMMCMYIEIFHVTIRAPYATIVVYRILFGVMNPKKKHIKKTPII